MIRQFTEQKMWFKLMKIAGSSGIEDKGIKMTTYKGFLTKVGKFYEVCTSILADEKMD